MAELTIERFDGAYAFLSNFYPSPVRFAEVMAPTVEHAFQASKTLDKDWQLRILAAPTPGKAKRLGRKAPLRGDWELVKLLYMRELLTRKFSDPALAQMLLETGDAKLIEGNTWGDKFWGKCDGEGQNWLGRLLQDIREEVKKGCNFVTL